MTEQPTNSLIVQPHPFSAARIDAVVPPGSTIAQAVTASGLPPRYGRQVRVWVGEWEVPRELWATARPKAGLVVYIKVFPGKGGGGGGGGGGKSPLATVLSLAVMIAAPGIGSAIAGSLGLGTIATIGSYALTWGTVIGMGVGLIGGALINALVGTPAPPKQDIAQGGVSSWGQTAPSYQITGTQNRFQPYAPIPRVLGAKRIYPMMAARPCTESQGGDRYVRLLLLAGYGPLKLSDWRIGETPLSAFDGVEIEVTEGGAEGWAGNAPITLYTQAIREDSLSVGLTAAGGWQLRQTRTATAEIGIDLSFSRGLATYASDGSRVARTVTVEVQYRKVGTVPWLTPAWANSADAGMEVDGTITATDTTQSATMRGARWLVAEAAQYEVQVRRTTADAGPRDVDTTTWSALRSVQHVAPVNQKNVALAAVRIKASEQLNGVPDSINCLAEAYHPVWDGAAWSWQLTRNPAWEAVDLLRRRGGETLMADSRIDLDGFLAFAAANDATPPNGPGPYWTYDGVVEGGSIFAALHDVLSHGRASRTMRDGKHSVVMDAPQTVPVQHITPRNSWSYSGSKKFFDLPHALHIKFTNADRGYVEDQLTVYADGYDETSATLFETQEYYGCTRSEQAWRIGRYLLAIGRLRPEDHSIYLDIENLRCTRGDLVAFAHDVILVGLASGRVRGTTVNDAGYITAVTLDGTVPMAAGQSYAIRCRRANGASVLCAVNTVVGEHETLTITTPIPEAIGMAAGDLAMFGEAGKESMPCIVKKIERGPQLTAQLTLVDAAPGVWTADSGPIPAFNSYIGSGINPRNQKPAAPSIAALRSDATVILRLADGTLQDRIGVSLAPPAASDVQVTRYELRWRETGAADWGPILPVLDASATGWITPVLMGTAYDVQARAISLYGVPSDWTQADPHTVIGKSSKPGSMPWATLSGDVLRWGLTDEQDLDGAIWRWQPGTNRSWGDANPLHDGLVQAPYTLTNKPLGQVTLLGKLVDIVGNDSVEAVAIVTDFGDPLVANVIMTVDCHAAGFTGARTNATVDGATGDLMATADASPAIWTDDDAALWTTDSAPMWAATTYKPMTYVDRIDVVPADAGSQLTVASDIAAASYAIDYRRDGAAPLWSDDLDPFWTGDADPLWTIEAWQSWPGAVVAEPAGYEFSVTTSASATRGRIAALTFQLDVEDITEEFFNVALAAGGTRLAITRTYRAIKGVHLTMQHDGGTARRLEVMDKNATLGPLCQGFDAANAGAAAHADATIQGY